MIALGLKACTRLLMLVSAFTITVAPLRADTVSDFYSGKNVTIIVSIEPGGSYSTFALLLRRYLGKYIPGNPTVIVQHMPGAGGVLGANYLYNVAPKDGTYVGTFNSAASTFAFLNPDKVMFDPLKFTWLSSWSETVVTLLALKTSPVTTLEQARSKEMVVASIGQGSVSFLVPTLLNAYMGTKFKIVTGYRGGTNIYLALERGEVDGYAGLAESVQVSRREWIEQKKVAYLVQVARKPYNADLADVPILNDLATDDEQRQVFAFLTAGGLTGRAVQLPPSVPTDRVDALRKAVDATYKDQEFLAEAEKQLFVINPISAEETYEAVKTMSRLPAHLRDKLQ